MVPTEERPILSEMPLVGAMLRGEEEAWERFLREYGPVAERAARKTLGGLASPNVVDEVVAGVCQILLERDRARLKRFRGESALATWVWCLARGIAIDRLRRERALDRRRVPLPREMTEAAPSAPSASAPSESAAERVRVALERLPEREQRALRMAYWEEWPYARIADELGLSVESVGPLLARAKAQLLEILKSSTG